MQLPLPLDGRCSGPLFGALRGRGPKNHGTRMPGTHRRRRERQATPPWVSSADLRPFYVEARRRTKATGVTWSVEHIVPLKGHLVCGLHCPANLTWLPLEENMKKGHHWGPGMPEEQVEMFYGT